MKQCPKCKAAYADDTLAFCLEDGTPLAAARQTDLPTAVYSETELVTSVRQSGIKPDPRFMDSQVTRVGSLVSPPMKSSKTGLVLALMAVGLLLVIGIAGIIGYIFYLNSGGTVAGNTPANLNTNANIPTIPTPTPSVKPTSTMTPAPTPKATPTAISTPPPERASYPSTSRLKFARGAFTTSFSGDINPGDRRSMVLACRSGQSLRATVNSPGGCVRVGGSTSYSTITNSGDNYVPVISSCSSVVRFTITVTII